MADNLTVFNTDYTGVTGIKAKGTGNGMLTYIRPRGTKTITENGANIDVTKYAAAQVDVTPNLQSKIATPTISQQIISADNSYDGLSQVTVDSIPSEYIVPSGTITITENGTVDVSSYINAEVNVSSESGGDSGNRSDPIRFFDYDGTLIASYTSVPDSLPNIPTHDRLTNGTWNYTLEQISSQYAAVGTCDIGANYDTASGKNEIDVTLDSDHLEPWLCVAVNGTATVDWGDDSATDTITGTSVSMLVPVQHTYAQAGNYTITVDGTIGFYSSSTAHTSVLRPIGDTNGNRQYSRLYCGCITAIRIADGSYINASAFQNCYNLMSVSIPSSITDIGNSAFQGCYNLTNISIPLNVTSINGNTFQYCYSLTNVSIPSGVTYIGQSAFQYCYNLQTITIPIGITNISNYIFNNCSTLVGITIPSGVASIGAYAFGSCRSLSSVTIPSSVTSIGNSVFSVCDSLVSITIPSNVTSIGTSAFYNCYGAYEYHLKPTTPPTLAGTNAFTGIVSGTKIYVPAGSLEAYKTATNWSAYAAYMVEE